MKFSVIIPVYGVEKYLDECVASVLSQSYTDFEVILVDDKSPDNCPAICDGYAKKDNRIRVIHKAKNEGLGFARNSGMELAQGEYILFVDSDDTVSADMLAVYADSLQKQEDILACGLTFCHENKRGKTVRRKVLTPQQSYSDTPQKKADALAMLMENRVFQYAWNKAYRREFLSSCGLKFESTKLIEDFLFNMEAFTAAKTIRTLSSSFYFYRKPQHETLASKYAPDFFELVKRRFRLQTAFAQAFDQEKKHGDLFRTDYIKHCISAIVRNRSKKAGLSRKQQKEFIFEMLSDPLTVEVVADFTPQGIVYKLIRAMMKKKKVGALYVFCGLLATKKQF